MVAKGCAVGDVGRGVETKLSLCLNNSLALYIPAITQQPRGLEWLNSVKL